MKKTKYVYDCPNDCVSLAYHMGDMYGNGLGKLVKVQDNHTGGFHADGTIFTWEERQDPNIHDNHVYVRLNVTTKPVANGKVLEYEIHLGVYDTDDFCANIYKPLTIENWKELHHIYEELCIPEMMTDEILLGFGFEY